MKGLKLIGLASMVLAISACSGIGPRLTVPSTATQGHGSAPAASTRLQNLTGSAGALAFGPVHGPAGPSWMLPEAKSETLLYVSDLYNNVVYAYSYPKLKPVGELTTDMLSPDGLCTDKKGDLFVVNNTPNDNDIVEFAHGGTTPLQTLVDPAQIGVACSVDPVTGNLAVTNIENISFGAGSISIYPKATGNPTILADPDIGSVYFCAYDDKGNLYLDGFSGGPSDGSFEFAELPKGKSKFTPILLKNTTINFPGDIAWDGKYVDVADQEEAVISGSPPILTSAIYRTTGTDGKVVSQEILANSDDLIQYFNEGTEAIGVNFHGTFVAFWQYPKGGKEIKTLTGFSGPIGIALSK